MLQKLIWFLSKIRQFDDQCLGLWIISHGRRAGWKTDQFIYNKKILVRRKKRISLAFELKDKFEIISSFKLLSGVKGVKSSLRSMWKLVKFYKSNLF